MFRRHPSLVSDLVLETEPPMADPVAPLEVAADKSKKVAPLEVAADKGKKKSLVVDSSRPSSSQNSSRQNSARRVKKKKPKEAASSLSPLDEGEAAPYDEEPRSSADAVATSTGSSGAEPAQQSTLPEEAAPVPEAVAAAAAEGAEAK